MFDIIVKFCHSDKIIQDESSSRHGTWVMDFKIEQTILGS